MMGDRPITIGAILWIAAIVLLFAVLTGCVGSRMDYCSEIGHKWGKAKYDECRMVEATTFPQPRQSIDVYVYRGF